MGVTYKKMKNDQIEYMMIRALVRNNDLFWVDILDSEYPDWKKKDYACYRLFESFKKDDLIKYVDLGIVAAFYWVGEHLYWSMDISKELGYERDVFLARRYFLLAALYDYQPAFIRLKEYFGIDAASTNYSSEMYINGLRYLSDDSEEGKDLSFYWFQKAFLKGEKKACCMLADYYQNGVGTEQNYQSANELYRYAINYYDDSKAHYKYAINLYNGYGCEINREEAIKHLLVAIERKNEDAYLFLEQNYEKKEYYHLLKDKMEFHTLINEHLKIGISKIYINEKDFSIQFLYDNKLPYEEQVLYIKDVAINDKVICKQRKVGVLLCNYYNEHEKWNSKSISFNSKIVAGDIIRFTFEIYYEDELLFKSKTVKICIEDIGYKIELANGVEKAYLDTTTLEIPGQKSIILFRKENFEIKLEGVDVFGYTIMSKLSILNRTKSNFYCKLRDLIINGKYLKRYTESFLSTPSKYIRPYSIGISDGCFKDKYIIEFTVVIYNMKMQMLGISKRIRLYVDLKKGIMDDVKYIRYVDYKEHEEEFENLDFSMFD